MPPPAASLDAANRASHVSGVCGILRFDGKAVGKQDLERQMSVMAHRGPDRRAAWRDGVVGLAHLQMCVTREDRFDAQPLSNADLTLVADARLDNRDELAAALAIDPAALRDMPDSQVILRAYQAWGDACVDHLVGDFAFAVWDARAEKLVLARDHMGQRHIAFHHGEGFFAFASEIKGLWALPDVPRSIVEDRFGRAATMNTSQTIAASPYEGIAALAGGTVMTITAAGATSTRCYWTPHADPAHVGQDEAHYREAYRRVLGEAVACRLRRAAYPAGLFYGGGFDTTAIAALAGPIVNAQDRKFICVCSVMPEGYDGPIHHARPWAEICARHMPHVAMRYVTREGRDIFSAMEASFQAADNATSMGGYVTDEILQTLRREGARVVMDGFGGDYTLNIRGFPWLYDLLIKGQLGTFVAEFRAYQQHTGASAWRVFRGEVLEYLIPEAVRRARMRRRHGLARSGPTVPLQPRFAAGTRNALRMATPRAKTESAMRARMRATLMRLQRGRTLAGSLQAAAHGLEFTQPFHDKRVVELALAIPARFWTRGGRERYLARQALKDLYPPEFQTRGRGNDDLVPDFLAMVKSVEPQILAHIARMETGGRMAHIFDFPRMRQMLTRRSAADHRSGSEYDTHQAVQTFMQARFIEWFGGSNQ